MWYGNVTYCAVKSYLILDALSHSIVSMLHQSSFLPCVAKIRILLFILVNIYVDLDLGESVAFRPQHCWLGICGCEAIILSRLWEASCLWNTPYVSSHF